MERVQLRKELGRIKRASFPLKLQAQKKTPAPTSRSFLEGIKRNPVLHSSESTSECVVKKAHSEPLNKF
jgi:hypothetical protein